MGEMEKRIRVYYAHAIPRYNTDHEKAERALIKKNIPNAQIIDPGTFQNNPEKLFGGMEYCLDLVEKCDALVFTRYKGEITSGVGKEVNHAIKRGLRVYALEDKRLKEIKRPVKYLSRIKTRTLYGWDEI